MDNYGEIFSKVYNERWTGFSRSIAPIIINKIKIAFPNTEPEDIKVLDLCCGTGQMAELLTKEGYDVTGIDISPFMLNHAKKNAPQARFILDDATRFKLDTPVHVVISLFDALNHLDGMGELNQCFSRTCKALKDDGMLLFDLNTRKGLSRWNGITIEDSSDFTLLNRGIFGPNMEKAYLKVTGFVPANDGYYERFEENFFNYVFEIDSVKELLFEKGFTTITLFAGSMLEREASDPESEGRIFFQARK